MIVVLSVAVGMVLWVITWSIGLKGFDGWLLALLIVLLATIIRSITNMLPSNQDPGAQPDAAPFN